MSGSACDVLGDGLASTVIQSPSNSQRSIEGHTISRTPEVCFGAVCLELLNKAIFRAFFFIGKKKPRVKSMPHVARYAKIFEDM